MFGVVNCNGETLATSIYETIVYRKVKDKLKKYWIKFIKNKRHAVKEAIVLENSTPHLLFYKNFILNDLIK